MITATFTGMEKINQNLSSIIQSAAPADRRKIFIDSSPTLIDAMKSKVPVDTGRLRDSIKVDEKKGISEGEAFVGVTSIRRTKKNRLTNPAVYGRIIEFGNRRQAAQPFVRPGFDSVKDRLINVIAGLFQRHILSKIK